ncbi:MAG: hypothetical protein GXP27_05030 [Planctomycetes bacterium]|nr:hypothetical protein [Planctomycetota bacterium]
MFLGTVGRVVLLLSVGAGAVRPSDVKPARQVEPIGQTRVRLQRAVDRLCSTPLDNLELVLADVSLQMKRRFTEYSGDISGRMLGALNAAAPLLGRKPAILDQLAARLPQYQKPDGHFGADQDFPHIVRNRDMPILWGNGRLLLAMAERCRDRPDPRLLASARKLGDYLIAVRRYFGKDENYERLEGPGGLGFATCYPSVIDGLVALGEVTGESRFYEEAQFIARLALRDKDIYGRHSHGRLVAFRGMLDLDRLTGRREFIDAVQTHYARIEREWLFPTGGVPEYFRKKYPRDEGCSVADWIRVSFLLWQATGRTAYLDAAAHTLRNHLLPMQFCNGGFGHGMFRTLTAGEKHYPRGAVGHVGAEAYWCCSMHGTQLLADAVRWAVLRSGSHFFVTWLAEAKATTRLDGRAMTISVQNGGCGEWQVTVEAEQPIDSTLHLRVPGWASSIRVDGKPLPSVNGWATVSRRWEGKTTLRVAFSDGIRLAGPYAAAVQSGEPVRVFAASDLFCLPEIAVDDDLLEPDSVPTVIVAKDRPTNGRIPVLVESPKGERQRAALVPIKDRPRGGAWYLFHVRKVDPAEFARLAESAKPPRQPGQFVEMEFACDGTFQLFFNGKQIHGQQAWWDGPQVEAYTSQPTNVVAILVRTRAKRPGLIGLIRVGDRTYVTRPKDWSAAPAPKRLTAEWLTDPSHGASQTVPLQDLGPLGVPPWEYVPGEFLGTGAHWIWPQTKASPREQRWLLRFVFKVQ